MLKELSWIKLLSANSYRAFLENPPLIRPTWLPSHIVWCAGIDQCLRLMVSFPLVHVFLSRYLSVLHLSPVFTIQRGYNYGRRRLSSYTRICCPLGILERGWEGVLPVLAFYFQGIRKPFIWRVHQYKYVSGVNTGKLFIWLVISWLSAESKAMKD